MTLALWYKKDGFMGLGAGGYGLRRISASRLRKLGEPVNSWSHVKRKHFATHMPLCKSTSKRTNTVRRTFEPAYNSLGCLFFPLFARLSSIIEAHVIISIVPMSIYHSPFWLMSWRSLPRIAIAFLEGVQSETISRPEKTPSEYQIYPHKISRCREGRWPQKRWRLMISFLHAIPVN